MAPVLDIKGKSLNLSLRHEVARLIVWPMFRPDLLFHQQYPTRMCGEVTTRTEPSDMVPTVSDWHLNREGTVYLPASGGDGAGWMVG
jgi:hypothetical protein